MRINELAKSQLTETFQERSSRVLPCLNCNGKGKTEFIKTVGGISKSVWKKCKYCWGKGEITIPYDYKRAAANDLDENRLVEEPDFGYTKYNNKENDLSKLQFRINDLSDDGFFEIIAYMPDDPDFDHGNIVVSKLAYKNPKAASVFKIWIYKMWHGTGLGQILYNKAIYYAKKLGFDYFCSDVALTANSISAWKKLSTRYEVTIEHCGVDDYYQIDLSKI